MMRMRRPEFRPRASVYPDVVGRAGLSQPAAHGMQNIMLRRRTGTDAPYLHHRQHRDAPPGLMNSIPFFHQLRETDEAANLRRFDVAVDDPLLLRVLDGLTDLDEQIEPLPGGEVGLVAIVGDLDAQHQFHDEGGGRPARRCSKLPPGLGVRQPSGAFGPSDALECGRGLPHSKTLPRRSGPVVPASNGWRRGLSEPQTTGRKDSPFARPAF